MQITLLPCPSNIRIFFAGVESPAPYRGIGGGGEEHLGIGVRSDGRHDALVTLEDPDRLPRLERPRPCRAVRGPADDDVFDRRPHRVIPLVTQVAVILGLVVCGDEEQREDAVGMPGELPDTVARVEVPATEGSVVGAAEDEVASADDFVYPA